jgi:hypothetical protein
MNDDPLPLKIFQKTHDPNLRWQDVQGGDRLLIAYLLDPSNEDIKGLILQKIKEQEQKAIIANDPFYINYPPKNYKPKGTYSIRLAFLSCQMVIGLSLDKLCQNLLLIGPSGKGKTSYLRMLTTSILDQQYGNNSPVIR